MRLIVIGPNGKMGRTITQIAADRDDLKLVGGLGPKKRDYIGQDLGQVARVGRNLEVSVADDLEKIIDQCEVIIDFSTKETSLEVLAAAVAHKKALVCGTTGFSEAEMAQFHEAGKTIPVLYAANTSKLVNVMNRLLQIATQLVGNETDIEIMDMHDRWKVDAPSGTAKEMGELIAHELGEDLKEIAVYGREGVAPREIGTIGYHSLRLGDVPSSHTVYFGGMGERLELTHHSYSWNCFASGACDAAVYLKDKVPGFYSFQEVLGLK